MKLLQFADLHLDPATAENTRPACAAILDLARRDKPDLIVNAGDLSMKRGLLAPWVSLALRELHVALAEIAPVIVVAGNHDLATGGSEVGTVMGALGKADALPSDLRLFERPGVVHLDDPDYHNTDGGPSASLEDERGARSRLAIACLPYPSKSWLLAQRPEIGAQEMNAALSALLLETLHGLAAQVPKGERAILVYHGSIAGARTDSEQTMTTEMDLVLEEHEIPACFEAVLAGHIHRPQQIGRAVYCGSPAPLTFAEEKSAHGCTLWSTGEESTDWTALPGSPWRYRHAPLPVAHPLLTLDLRESGARERRIERFAQGTRVRVKLALRPGEDRGALAESWERSLTTLGAHSVKVEIERPEAIRVDGPEVHAALSLSDLLAIYGARHPEAFDLLPEIEALALELEALLPPEARMMQAAAGYALERLEWSNWKSYGEGNVLDLERLGRLVAIEGENGSGKSNAAEVEAFALYGRFIRGDQPLADAVRIGASEAKVVAIFSAGGERFKVERRVKVNSKGRGSMDTAFFRWNWPAEDRHWMPCVLGTARETQALIERLVGPFDLYRQTRYAAQDEITSLTWLTAAEMKDTLQAALATSLFEAREKLARPALAKAERALEIHNASLGHLIEIATEKGEREQAVERAGSALGLARNDAESREAVLVAARERAEATRRAVGEIAERVAAWDASSAAMGLARNRLADATRAVATADAKIAEAAKAEEARAGLDEKRERLVALRGSAELRRARHAVLQGEQRTLATLRADLDRVRREARSRAVEQLARAKTDLADAERRAGMRMPFGDDCIKALCPFVRDAADARVRVPGLRDLVADAQRETIDPRVPELETRIAEHLKAETTALAALKEVEVDEVGLQRLAAEIAGLDAMAPVVEAGREARVRKEMAERDLPGLRDAAERARETHEALGARPEQGGLSEALAQAEARLSESGTEAATARRAVERAVEDLATARARLELAVEAEAKVAAAAEEGATLERKRRVAATWLTACGRDGLPYLMLERSLPALEAHANHFLCADLDAGLRLEIEGLRELQSGETRSEVVIRYANDFGTHSLAAASGFERTAIGYALRAALALLQAEAQGMRVSHWIADEGWGVFSELRIVTVGQPMLRRLAERFGRVIVISHQSPIVAVCDTRLAVEVDHARGSRLMGGAETVSPAPTMDHMEVNA